MSEITKEKTLVQKYFKKVLQTFTGIEFGYFCYKILLNLTKYASEASKLLKYLFLFNIYYKLKKIQNSPSSSRRFISFNQLS